MAWLGAARLGMARRFGGFPTKTADNQTLGGTTMPDKRQTEELALGASSYGGFEYLRNVNLAEIMAAELEGLSVSFDRVKVPSGGLTAFEMPGEDDDSPEVSKEFEAVILHHHAVRGYYREEYAGGHTPPDCGSIDGRAGVGDPGGKCGECPLDKFGTGRNGGKACKERRRLYLLQEGQVFPLLYSVPSASLKPFAKYVLRLLTRGLVPSEAVTRFSLKKAVSGGDLDYSEAAFKLARPLSDGEKGAVAAYAQEVRQMAAKVAVRDEEDDGALGGEPGGDLEPLI